MAIHRARGRGYREATYQRDLEVRLKLMGRDFDPEPRLAVYDSSLGDQLVGYYIPDFIVEKLAVVEIKALWGSDLLGAVLSFASFMLATVGKPVERSATAAPAPSASSVLRKGYPGLLPSFIFGIHLRKITHTHSPRTRYGNSAV